MMFDKLDNAENRYDELNHQLANPDVISDNNKYRSYMKEHAEIEPIVMKYRQYKKIRKNYDEAKNILKESKDSEMIQFAKMEMQETADKLDKIKDELKVLLLPKDPNDDKNVIVEIRGGAGGDEANLFASDLFRMYTKYAEKIGWKVSVMDISETEIGGIREVVFSIEGEMAYSKLKFESGVHRVQRVPETETSGRIHTSTVTVAVLPEVDDVDVEIDQNDLRIDTYRSSGAGGQHVNKTDSAIRITHMPSGIVVACQDERSQHKNKDKALKILRAKLYERAVEEQESKIAKERKSQVGRGNRNERIRTYNFPQGRVTDHRINLTLYKLDSILEGNIHDIIEALRIDEQTQNLEQIGIED